MSDDGAEFDPAGVLARLDEQRERLDRLEVDNADLKMRNAALESEVATMRAGPIAGSALAPAGMAGAPSRQPVGRRQALRTGLAAAGAAVTAGAVLLDAQPAAATNGQPVLLGTYNNAATAETGFVTTGGAAIWGLGSADTDVTDYGDKPAIAGYASGGFTTAVKALTANADGLTALRAEAHGTSTGARVSADNGIALVSVAPTGLGLAVDAEQGIDVVGSKYHLYFGGLGRGAPTQDTVAHFPGEVILDSSGDLWLCTASGTPGSFRKLGGPATAGQLHLLRTPARAYDSRVFSSPPGGTKAPLPANTARTIDLQNGSTGVPADARGVMVNVLLVNLATGNGNFTIWANGATRPLANTMVFGGNATRASTLAVTKIDTTGQCQVYSSLQTDLTVDVVGFYR